MLNGKSPRFAPVAPIQILEALLAHDARRAFGNYHLMLAHATTESDFRFRTLMANYAAVLPYEHAHIIMDNSIVELGGAVIDEMMQEAGTIVKNGMNTVIGVLPDVMGSGADTLQLSAAAYVRWEKMQMAYDSYMVVAQGATWNDFTHLINYFFIERKNDYKKIQWVGIPRKLLQLGSVRSRLDAIRYVAMVAPWINIHLLGFSDDIVDDLLSVRADIPQIAGIDSAVPVRYDKLLLPTTTDREIGPRGNWWQEGKLTPQAILNLSNVRCWLD